MSQCDAIFNLIIDVGQYGLYFTVQWFSLYLEDYLMDECNTFG